MKKIISVILTIIMILSIFGALAITVSAETYTSGDFSYKLYVMDDNYVACIEQYHGSANMIEIPSVIDGYPVTYIAQFAFKDCSSVTSITIPNGVTYIDKYAFGECTNLESITIPNSVTSIDEYAFYKCKNLASITIPNSVISIDEYAFLGCFNLTCIEVDDNNENYSSIDGNLYSKDGTRLEQYALGKTAASFTIPNGVTTISYKAFFARSNIKSVIIPGSVKHIGSSAFENCQNLSRLTISYGVENIASNAFRNCTNLDDVTIPGSVKFIGLSAFESCKSLSNLTISYGVEQIASKAFQYCSSLNNVTIPDSVTDLGPYTFNCCTNLTSITLSKNITGIDQSVLESTGITEIIIPEGVTYIDMYAFYGCDSLTNIIIPESVTCIDHYAFKNCTNLTRIDIHSNTIEFGKYVFDGCESMSLVVIAEANNTIDKSVFPSQVRIIYGRYDMYIIKYDANGGVGVPETQTIYTNESIVLSDTVPTKQNYSFLGWTEHLCSDIYYEPSSVFRGNRNVTLYAVWEKQCPECKGKGGTTEEVRCDRCNGSGSNNKTSTCDHCQGTGESIENVVHLRCEVCNGTGFYGGSKCFYCKGAGMYTKREITTCPKCSGTGKVTGKVECSYCHGYRYIINEIKCPACDGKGKIIEKTEHTYEWVVTKPATKTQTGRKVKRCLVCGAVVESKTIPKITQYILGDVDSDGEVSIIDATLIQRHLAELAVSAYNESVADADGDGDVTIMDATGIQRFIAELPFHDGIGKPIT